MENYIKIGELSPQDITISLDLFYSICNSVREEAKVFEDEGKYYISNYKELSDKIYNKLDNYYRSIYGEYPSTDMICHIENAFKLDNHTFEMYLQEYFFENPDTKVTPNSLASPPEDIPTIEASYSYKDIDSLVKKAIMKEARYTNEILQQYYDTVSAHIGETPLIPNGAVEMAIRDGLQDQYNTYSEGVANNRIKDQFLKLNHFTIIQNYFNNNCQDSNICKQHANELEVKLRNLNLI